MSEPSSSAPKDIVDAEVEETSQEEPERVELDVDEEKVEAWDEVKADYQVEPGGHSVPNSMAATQLDTSEEPGPEAEVDVDPDQPPPG
jgi:hypothetical protein